MLPHTSFQPFLCAHSLSRAELFGRETAPLVSFSGGQDSIFLSWLVFHLQDERQLQPIGLYYNHLWHAEGFFHGLHCLRLAFIFGWPFIYTLPMHSVSDETRAWAFRHHLRGRIAIFYAIPQADTPVGTLVGTPLILLGHTKTDRLESFLYQLFRGSLHRDEPLPDQNLILDEIFPVITEDFNDDNLVKEAQIDDAFRDDLFVTGSFGSEAAGPASLILQRSFSPPSAYQLIRSKASIDY